jgi:hypothetical protein
MRLSSARDFFFCSLFAVQKLICVHIKTANIAQHREVKVLLNETPAMCEEETKKNSLTTLQISFAAFMTAVSVMTKTINTQHLTRTQQSSTS